ncbi:protein NUCLEAR FUSION DEFECTIVE 4-like [Mercurialis annua]|uniref:protein NUCLEAR FUSION DEFECTIVE 4-like n=1 Tax=Mercurialis annua TaxID=3986 RepID=UPI00215ECF4C|nr:protein NUCLEAR FUSION DEFECTIVE 4-like [Mercurialis annua]XP_050215055.1 protein NUCLEAR FUSION DEFECTIVE 4-like [Mercurialis annua]
MANLKAGTRPPWVGLGAGIWVQIASGNAYNFPLYSHSLKSVLGFNQHQLTMLGVANDIGENVGLIPGIACNKFPPWVILFIGSLACFFGYGVLWLAVSRTVQSLPHWLLFIALCIGANSSAWLSTAVLVTNMRNFPLSRGTVAGIIKGYSGISAAVFTAIYSMLLDNSSSKLLMFLAVGIPVLCFIMMYFVKACTPASGEDSLERPHFLFIQATLVILALYVLITTIVDHLLHLSSPISYSILAIMIILLMSPLAIPLKMTLCRSRATKSDLLDQSFAYSDSLVQGEGNGDKTEPLLTLSALTQTLGSFREEDESSEVAMLLAEGEGAVKKRRRPRRGEDFKFSEAVVKADFWLLFFVYFVGVGSGVTVLNNLAQIGIAQGVHDTTTLLSLFSFCNFVGRLGGGIVSEHFVRSKTIPRTTWLTCSQTVMIAIYLLFASAIDGTLYAATALLGVCYGVQFSIMIPTVSELFGLKHFGIFFNFMSIGNPLGAFLFSGLLAGYVYDREAAKQQGMNMLLNSGIACIGPNCFRLTFLVLAGVCGVGSIFSIILTMRIRPVYEMLYAGGSFKIPQTSTH